MAVYNSAGLPTPSGPYRVGCIDVMPPEDSCPLVRLFYPSNTESSVAGDVNTTSTCYWFPRDNYIRPYVEFLGLSPVDEVTDGITRCCNPAIPAQYNVPIGTGFGEHARPLSVVVFSHGRGGMRTRYSAICCDLASCGYLVAVPEHGDSSASVGLRLCRDPLTNDMVEKWLPYRWTNAGESEVEIRIKQVEQRTVELSRTLDLLHSLNNGCVDNLMEGSLAGFTGRLNLQDVALIGHSLGGASIINCLSTDKRYGCGLALDPLMMAVPDAVYSADVSQPLLFINSAGPYQTADSISRIRRLLKPCGNGGISQCNMVTLKGSVHRSQMDTLFVLPQHFFTERPSLDIFVCHRANMSLCHAFLKRYLLRDPMYQDYLLLLDGNTDHIIQGSNK